jgi:hypothetical protein
MANTWGLQTWGFNQWNDLDNVSYTLTGQDLSLSLADVTTSGEINEGWGRANGWGTAGWGIQGTLQVTGIAMSADIGSVSINSEINIGWGSDTWGYETWGISGLTVDLTGIELTATLDSVTTKSDVDYFTVTGQQATITQGDTLGSATVDVDLTGQPMTATLQYQEAIVNPTGQELTANDGTAVLDANTIAEVSATSAATWNGNFAWGYGVWGNEQVTTLAMSMQEGDVDPAPDVSLTGNAAAMFLGEETVTADANAFPTGEELTAVQGTATLDANTQVDVTGQLMSMQEGDETVTGNARVSVTGNALTMATGTVYNLIWNDVNTGTAPIVPPGWQEVDTAA